MPFWLAVASIYALYSAFTWGQWQDLAFWTRVHVSVMDYFGQFPQLQ